MTNPGSAGLPLNMKPWGTRTCISRAIAARIENPCRLADRLCDAVAITPTYQLRGARQLAITPGTPR
jgi:hypothetical protein